MANKRTTWGHWRLETSNWTLVHEADDGSEYEVDLERMATGKEVLDWICHISERADSREEVGYFVEALSEIFGHLPGTFQQDETVDVATLLKEKYG